MSNRNTLIFAAVLAVIVLVFHYYAKKQPSQEEVDRIFSFFRSQHSWQGRYAPDFEIELLNGERFKLSEAVGKKVIVINFFSVNCGPCIGEMPELNRYYDDHAEEPFILIGINADEGGERVRDFVAEYKVTFPVGIDKNGEIRKRYGVRGFPTTVFIGPNGMVDIYEIGPIMNADVAFNTPYKRSMNILKAEKGIEKEEYLIISEDEVLAVIG